MFRYTCTVKGLSRFSWSHLGVSGSANSHSGKQSFRPQIIDLLNCFTVLSKTRHGRLGLVQKAASIMLHGHATNKHISLLQLVFICLLSPKCVILFYYETCRSLTACNLTMLYCVSYNWTLHIVKLAKTMILRCTTGWRI